MIRCPILNREIDEGECTSITMASDEYIKEDTLPNEVTLIENWREICLKCKYHNN